MELERMPRKILVLDSKRKKKIRLSKVDKNMLENNKDLLPTININCLYAIDRKWVEARRI